jgi:hypothetical protein
MPVHVSDGLNMVVTDTANATAWRIVQSRPSGDQFAPVQVGDFDARPLEEALYDTGYVGATVEMGDGTVRGIYVIRPGSWEYVNWANTAGTLAADLAEDANSITVVGVGTITPPRTEEIIKTDGSNDTQANTIVHPGVVWVGDERIEFFANSVVGGNTILTQLRRGTNNTRIGVEQSTLAHTTYAVQTFTGNTIIVSGTIIGPVDSSNLTFTLNGVTSLDGLVVATNETLRYPSGEIVSSDGYTGYPVNVPKFNTVDYTAALVGGNLVVTFKKAPPSGSTVYITLNRDAKHLAGTIVRDGQDTLDHRPDGYLGGDVQYDVE